MNIHEALPFGGEFLTPTARAEHGCACEDAISFVAADGSGDTWYIIDGGAYWWRR